jgi:CRP/FNR family cyclic AMP-dependent transcriptional regulator
MVAVLMEFAAPELLTWFLIILLQTNLRKRGTWLIRLAARRNAMQVRMMSAGNGGAELFKGQILASLRLGRLPAHTVKFCRHDNVYLGGDSEGMIYVIESGQIKIAMLSQDGKERLAAIHTSGDIFGECGLGCGPYSETATAMSDTTVNSISRDIFLHFIAADKSILNGFICYLARRIVEQQQIILDLTTANSEYRLGKMLLQLGNKLGKKYPSKICLSQKISHEELSHLVGTTRPRISWFMSKFRRLGLIEVNPDRFLIINENSLSKYLTSLSQGRCDASHKTSS